MILNKQIVLKYFNNPDDESKIIDLIKSKGYFNVTVTNYKKYGDVFNNAIYYLITKYPGIKNIKIISFARFVAFLTSKTYINFEIEDENDVLLQFERNAENIICNWKNVTKLNDEEFTKKAIKFLEYFYFKNPMQTVELFTEFNIEDPELTANVILYLLRILNNK